MFHREDAKDAKPVPFVFFASFVVAFNLRVLRAFAVIINPVFR
jgi:hypothetical protein